MTARVSASSARQGAWSQLKKANRLSVGARSAEGEAAAAKAREAFVQNTGEGSPLSGDGTKSGSAITGNVNVWHSPSPARTAQAQIIEYNLKQMGFSTTDVPTPGTVYYTSLGKKGTTYDIARAGWCADYFDPFDYINTLLDGRSIQDANNVNLSYLDVASLNTQMDQAAALSGAQRAAAYKKLDLEIMQKYAPWVPYEVDNNRYFTSARVKNWIYSTYFGEPDMNALAVE